MAPSSSVYIAGVGYSSLPSKNSSTEASVATLISAATKALLDAGVTYDDITHGVVSKSSEHGADAFKAFEDDGVVVKKAQESSELETSFTLLKDGSAKSILMITEEESAAIAFVLISDDFLWSRPYLKDSSAILREQSSPGQQASEKVYDICQMIWSLRGWADSTSGSKIYRSSSNKIFELNRSDKNKTPKWEDIEHKQDGKHRLGYNPAKTTQDISSEDFAAVTSSKAKSGNEANDSRFKRRGGDRAALARL